jgi:hypothetical protein
MAVEPTTKGPVHHSLNVIGTGGQDRVKALEKGNNLMGTIQSSLSTRDPPRRYSNKGPLLWDLSLRVLSAIERASKVDSDAHVLMTVERWSAIVGKKE